MYRVIFQRAQRRICIAGMRAIFRQPARALRVLLGAALIGLIMYLATWAVRDCPFAPYVYENCLWLRARDLLHFPQSKLLRGAFLEMIGFALLAGTYLTIRHLILPSEVAKASAEQRPSHDGDKPDSPSAAQ